MRRRWLLLLAMPLVYTLRGMLPGRLLVPADLPRDLVAWKGSRTERIAVSNSLLSDVPLQFIPWDVEARRQLSAGRVPWRNEFGSSGAPLFANPQAALLSPFTWPRLLLGLNGWSWSVYLKICVSALAMFWLARTLGTAELPSLISAFVFAFSGSVTTLIFHPHTNVIAVLPALCAAGVHVSQHTTPRNVAVVAGIAALATAGGHPETLFVGVLAITVFLFVARSAVPSVRVFLTASLAGFLLLGIQLIPFFGLLRNSHARAARLTELPVHFRFLSILGQWWPGMLGSPLKNEIDLTGIIPHADNFVGRAGAYIGGLVLLAILATCTRLPATIRRGLLIGVFGLLLGWCVPGVCSVVRLLPIVRWMALDYFVIAFVLFGALAAGPAMSLFCTMRRPRLGFAVLAVGMIALAGGAIAVLDPGLVEHAAATGIDYLLRVGYLHQPPSVYAERLARYVLAARWTAFRRVVLPAACAIVAGVGMLMRHEARRHWLCTTAALAELVVFGYGFAPAIRIADVPPVPASVLQLRQTRDLQWFVAGPQDAFPDNLGTVYGLRQVASYDVLTSEEETQRLVAAGYDPFFHGFLMRPTPQEFRVLADMGVRWWVDRDFVEIPDAKRPPPPRSGPPQLFGIGAIVSGLGGALLLVLLVFTREDRAAPALTHIGLGAPVSKHTDHD